MRLSSLKELLMNRRTAILGAGSALGAGLLYNSKGKHILDHLMSGPASVRMPLFYFGHGSPMNAILDNEFTRTLLALGVTIPRAKAILMISAHWMTNGHTAVTAMDHPETIHDFGGFPQELFDVRYPAAGDPALAKNVQNQVSDPLVRSDVEWGLDHGTWSVLKNLFPKADIPVVQLSIDMTREPEYHFNIGRQLLSLRDKGVLIMGSGNIVHNLRRIKWELNPQPYDWAIEFDEWAREKLVKGDYQALLKDPLKSEAGRLSIPTMDHYLPLAFILGAAKDGDNLRFEFEDLQMGSMSMRSFSLGMT
jgi:4,5-DOPA dioxygenase extradiol